MDPRAYHARLTTPPNAPTRPTASPALEGLPAHHARIDVQRLPRDPVSFLGGEESDCGHHILRHAVALDGLQGFDEAERLLVRSLLHALGIDQARANRIGGDLVWSELCGERPGEGEHASLGGDVMRHVRRA